MDIFGFRVGLIEVVSLIFIWLLLAILCENMAHRRGRSRALWFILSLIFPFALIIVAALPSRR